jgi:hypothetical protein
MTHPGINPVVEGGGGRAVTDTYIKEFTQHTTSDSLEKVTLNTDLGAQSRRILQTGMAGLPETNTGKEM